MQADIPIPRAHDLTGSVLGGRYEVLGKLGIGGMAAVYEGRRLGLHNRVAIKVLKDELCEDPGNVKRFLREARAASVIEHENIVQIIDFGPVDGTPVYFVMEFLEGSDLRRVIRQAGPLPWAQAQPIMLQVVTALAAAHDKGIVHRDVKPANIFLVPRPHGQPMVKVLDFGIAKVVEEGRGGITRGLTMTNGLLGTVAYMAPEQARGGKIDARTDVYAMGVLAFQAMTGSVPFTGNNPFMVLERHVNEIPRPPREIVPTIPHGVDEIVLRCLSKRPEDRYQSMAELAEAIRRVPASAVPTMGNPAPVVHVTAGPEAWAKPPELEVPIGDGTPRVIATERLGSGSGHVIEPGTARSPGTWAPAPVATTARTPSHEATLQASQSTHKLPTPTPYRAFFALGLGLGIVAASAIAFFAVTHYEREPEATPDMATDQIVEETPAAIEAPVKQAAPPAKVADVPETSRVPETPEPETPEPEVPDVVETPTADASETPRTNRRKKPRDPPRTKVDPPTKTSSDKPPRKPDPDPDVHPDLREPYN